MANIMINETCNQKCSYCFASEFVNIKKNDISFDCFVKAVEFILTEKDDKRKGRIGLIGGEPLLHPQFDEFVHYLINRMDVKHITVYTNGVLLNQHLDSILNKKVGLLININSIKDVGEENFSKTQEAVDELVNKYNKKNITLGLNIYDDIDYSFFILCADKYRIPKVRLSIVVPAYNKKKSGYTHFTALKNNILKVTKELLLRDINFGFDCNWPVPCMWTIEEKHDLEIMGLMGNSRDRIPSCNCCCIPVIDILPDLTAIRCFGLSDISKQPIGDFADINELRDFYYSNLDLKLCKVQLKDGCDKCDMYPHRCYGGCLANRVN